MRRETTTYKIYRSRVLIFFLVFIYGGASGCVFLLPFYFLWKFLLLFFCVGSFIYQSWHYIYFCGKNSYMKLTYIGGGKWHLCDRQQKEAIVLLQKSSVVWSHCIILHFRSELSRRFLALLIFGDAMSVQDFRQLKVCVRTAKW